MVSLALVFDVSVNEQGERHLLDFYLGGSENHQSSFHRSQLAALLGAFHAQSADQAPTREQESRGRRCPVFVKRNRARSRMRIAPTWG